MVSCTYYFLLLKKTCFRGTPYCEVAHGQFSDTTLRQKMWERAKNTLAATDIIQCAFLRIDNPLHPGVKYEKGASRHLPQIVRADRFTSFPPPMKLLRLKFPISIP